MKFRLDPDGGNGNKQSLYRYRRLIKERVGLFKARVAEEVYAFQVPDNSSSSTEMPLFSGYFRANWLVSVGGAGEPLAIAESERPKRSNVSIPSPTGQRYDVLDAKEMQGKFAGRIDTGRARDVLGGAKPLDLFRRPVLVYNNTWYGRWLNNGGYDAQTVVRMWPHGRLSHGYRLHRERTRAPYFSNSGSRFIERCVEHINRLDWPGILRDIRKNHSTLEQ